MSEEKMTNVKRPERESPTGSSVGLHLECAAGRS